MDYQRSVETLWNETARLWTPPPKLSLSKWLDEYYYIPAGDPSAGKWTTLPYQRGIADAMTDPNIERVTIMKSARIGYTKLITGLIGYYAHQDPRNVLVVQPTVEDAQGFSKDEMNALFRDTPVLQHILPENKTRDGKNTILRKELPGMNIWFVGANSARGFRRISVGTVIFDETDGYPPSAGSEGDQIALGIRRTEYYWNRKIIMGSTPTIKGLSRIERSFETSDKRYFNVPCPFCKNLHKLEWSLIDFSDHGTVKKPVYMCVICKKPIGYQYHRWMIENGEWIATAPFTGHAGFHPWSAYSYSPNATWAQIVKEFLEAKKHPDTLKTWVNTILGETWEEAGETIEENSLYSRRENYGKVPKEAAIIVSSADVQKDRIEVLTCAYGRDYEIWALDFTIIQGNPTGPAIWEEFDACLLQGFEHESGATLHPSIAFVDSGAFTQEVYAFVKPREGRRVYAIKGLSANKPGQPIVSRPSKSNIGKVKLFSINTITGKDMLFDRLRTPEPGPAYIHFNMLFDLEFFIQLTAEKRVIKYTKGVARKEYVKVSPGRRNEAIDLFVYNLAGFYSLNIRNINEYVDRLAEGKSLTAKKKKKRRMRSKGIT